MKKIKLFMEKHKRCLLTIIIMGLVALVSFLDYKFLPEKEEN